MDKRDKLMVAVFFSTAFLLMGGGFLYCYLETKKLDREHQERLASNRQSLSITIVNNPPSATPLVDDFPSPARNKGDNNGGAYHDGTNISLLFDKRPGQDIQLSAWAIRAEDLARVEFPPAAGDFQETNFAHLEMARQKLPTNTMIFVRVESGGVTRYFQALLTGHDLSPLVEASEPPLTSNNQATPSPGQRH